MAPKRNQVAKEAASTPQPQAKKQKKDPVSRKLREQLKEINLALDGSTISDEVKGMLAEVLPMSLGEYSEHRHKFQQQIVEAVSDIMDEVEAGLTKVVEDTRSQYQEATSVKPMRDREASEAAAKLEAAKADTHRCKVALADAARVFRNARQSLTEAEEAKSIDAQKSLDAQKTKQALESGRELLNALRTLAPQEAEAVKKQSDLVALLKRYKFEDSILVALPAALEKAPDARGQFDLMAIGQLEGEIVKRIAEQESILAAAKPGQEKCDAVVREAEATLHATRMKQKITAQNFDVASKHQSTCEETSATTSKAVSEMEKSSKRLAKDVYNAEAEVELFQEGPKETFRALCERIAPVAMEEEPEPAEFAAEEPRDVQEAEAPAVAVC